MWPLGSFIGALVIISITHWVYRWRNPKCNGKLPPGSMGWPLLGHTFQFFAQNRSLDIPVFIKERMERYGPIFRTNLVGQQVIVSAESELSSLIFQEEGKLFKSWYPSAFMEVLGKQNIVSLHGFMHKYLRNMTLNLFGPDGLKKMLYEVEQATCKNLKKWSNQGTIELKGAVISKLISYDEKKSSKNLRENFVGFVEGLISFPLYVPGMAFYKCLQLRETTPGAITMATKFLSDHPLVLKELTEEHEEIIRRRENLDSGFTWEEYKSMTFTFQVINETVRLANVVPLMFSKALQDVKFKGYTIPAGWAVMVSPLAVHLNPANYENPLEFNPWRWKGKELHSSSKDFMAFGANYSKVQMAVFLHCLVTKYRFKAINGGDIVRTPGLHFPDGFYIGI